MTAGKRDHLVTLQAYTTAQDGYGEEVPVWPPDGGSVLGQEWAQVLYGMGDERRQAAMQEGQQAATFRMLSNTLTRAVTVKSRIVLDGDNWDIKSISPDTPRRGEIEFTATRSL